VASHPQTPAVAPGHDDDSGGMVADFHGIHLPPLARPEFVAKFSFKNNRLRAHRHSMNDIFWAPLQSECNKFKKSFK
jgi:hypothetical protein